MMTTHTFVGPDGKAYSENKPEEGGFLSYFDGCKWLITFPVKNGLERSYYFFFGDRLPSSAGQWEVRLVGTPSPFPAYIQACQ
jgi:hypothetical protein